MTEITRESIEAVLRWQPKNAPGRHDQSTHGRWAAGQLSREDWEATRDRLRTEQSKTKHGKPKVVSEAEQAINLEKADIEKRGQKTGWTNQMRQDLKRLENERLDAQQEAAGQESLTTVFTRYAEYRVSNYQFGLDKSTREMADAIAEAAQIEGKPVPPEVLADYPDLVK